MDVYDEEIVVKNSREIESPVDLNVEDALSYVNRKDGEKLSDGADDLDFSHKSVDFPQSLPKMSEKRPKSSVKKKTIKSESYDGSETDTEDSISDDTNKVIGEHEFNPKLYENLEAPSDVKEMFQYMSRYTPQKIDIEYKLQPFIPEFIPAVGDIDAFLKVMAPEALSGNGKELTDFISRLGLEILDEPCGDQSEPALLHMKLRSITTGPQAPGPPPSIAKSSKDIERWIAEIQNLHANQPAPNVNVGQRQIPDIDSLMAEWPAEMEQALNTVGFPNGSLDCSLAFYIELVCSLLDIPIKNKTQSDYIVALYTLFNLYSSINKPVGL